MSKETERRNKVRKTQQRICFADYFPGGENADSVKTETLYFLDVVSATPRLSNEQMAGKNYGANPIGVSFEHQNGEGSLIKKL